MRSAILFIAASVLAVPSVAQEDCNLDNRAPIALSDSSASEILVVAVRGTTCTRAVFEYTVLGAQGDTLYMYTDSIAAFAPHKLIEEDARRVARSHIDIRAEELRIEYTDELPPFTSPVDYWDKRHEELLVDTEKYRALRQQHYPTLIHGTFYEGWRRIYFDRKRHEIGVLSQGSI